MISLWKHGIVQYRQQKAPAASKARLLNIIEGSQDISDQEVKPEADPVTEDEPPPVKQAFEEQSVHPPQS